MFARPRAHCVSVDVLPGERLKVILFEFEQRSFAEPIGLDNRNPVLNLRAPFVEYAINNVTAIARCQYIFRSICSVGCSPRLLISVSTDLKGDHKLNKRGGAKTRQHNFNVSKRAGVAFERRARSSPPTSPALSMLPPAAPAPDASQNGSSPGKRERRQAWSCEAESARRRQGEKLRSTHRTIDAAGRLARPIHLTL